MIEKYLRTSNTYRRSDCQINLHRFFELNISISTTYSIIQYLITFYKIQTVYFRQSITPQAGDLKPAIYL